MLRSLYLSLIYLLFLLFGAAAPFVLSLGYVWVDTFDPQAIATELLNAFPVSLIMGLAAIGSYVVFDTRKVRVPVFSLALIAFAIWCTLSTAFWAEVPGPAWYKWNYAFKTICFAAFLPLVFRSRVHIEAFVQIYLFSMLVHLLPVGAKTLISGGGYGRELGITSGNSLLAEGATLATVALMLVPLMLHLRSYTTILPRTRLFQLGYLGFAVIAVAAAVGTFERTALVGMAVCGLGLWLKSRRKLLFGVIGAIGIAIAVSTTGGAWSDRISTVKDYNSESSALGRILVWKWTLGYVGQHPLGGGFNVYMIDNIEFPGASPNDPPTVVHGKAFHSIYFEVLGEQGFPGLALFLGLIGYALLQAELTARRIRKREDLRWAHDLARSLQVSIVTAMTCGAFVGIAFQPIIYNVLAMTVCLTLHVKRVLAGEPKRSGDPYHAEDALWSDTAVVSS